MKIPAGNNNSKFIKWLFRGRCVICYRPGTEINEIVPRSQSGDALFWKNRVLMCRECHSEYHHLGTSETAIRDLQNKREMFLHRIDRADYI